MADKLKKSSQKDEALKSLMAKHYEKTREMLKTSLVIRLLTLLPVAGALVWQFASMDNKGLLNMISIFGETLMYVCIFALLADLVLSLLWVVSEPEMKLHFAINIVLGIVAVYQIAQIGYGFLGIIPAVINVFPFAFYLIRKGLDYRKMTNDLADKPKAEE